MNLYARILGAIHEQEIKSGLDKAVYWLSMLLLQGDAIGLKDHEREEIDSARVACAAAVRWLHG